MSALRALLPRRWRTRRHAQPSTSSSLFGAAFLRAVEPPAMTLDGHLVEDDESGATSLTTAGR